jgi:hypothetical protein
LVETELVHIDSVDYDPDNSRTHDEDNLRAIANSLQRFGQVLPLVVWEGIVIGGNGTLKCMHRLGHKEVEITRFEGTKEEAMALAIALNRSAELAGWDVEQLGESLVKLSEAGYEMPDLGFSAEALEGLFPESPDPPADYRQDTPPLQDPADDKSPKVAEPDKPLIQYALIFDNEHQQQRFFAALRKLKKKYKQANTNAERLDLFLAEQLL